VAAGGGSDVLGMASVRLDKVYELRDIDVTNAKTLFLNGHQRIPRDASSRFLGYAG
jgi:hypothetical protein